MKKITVNNYSGIIDASEWIRQNQAEFEKVKSGVHIDLSGVEYVHSSIVGFVIYLMCYYEKHEIECVVTPPEDKLMLNVFGDILKYFEAKK